MNTQLRATARKNADSAYTEAFREEARLAGGFNPATSARIKSAAVHAGQAAYTQTYLDAGYAQCGCGSLVNPDFARCFLCGAWKKSAMPASAAESTFVAALVAANEPNPVVYTALTE